MVHLVLLQGLKDISCDGPTHDSKGNNPDSVAAVAIALAGDEVSSMPQRIQPFHAELIAANVQSGACTVVDCNTIGAREAPTSTRVVEASHEPQQTSSLFVGRNNVSAKLGHTGSDSARSALNDDLSLSGAGSPAIASDDASPSVVPRPAHRARGSWMWPSPAGPCPAAALVLLLFASSLFSPTALGQTALTQGNINDAVTKWISGIDTTTYGNIVDWDVSAVSNMNELFTNKLTFNADISKWNTACVSSMSQVCSSPSHACWLDYCTARMLRLTIAHRMLYGSLRIRHTVPSARLCVGAESAGTVHAASLRLPLGPGR